MLGIVIAIHVIACVGLIFFILIQSGRGGGLIESFTSAESIFGTKTNAFLTKATTALAITFFITCLALAFLSVQQNKSIVQREVGKQSSVTTKAEEVIPETTEAQIPEVAKESIQQAAELTQEAEQASQNIPQPQTQTVEQTQETNAATEQPAAIQ